MILSYHNDKTLKADMVSEMEKHQEADAIIKGTYGKENGIFKGCAVGCGVRSLNVKRGKEIAYNDHATYASELGIPEWLARLEDTLFENLPEKEAKLFPLEFTKAIPVGINLEPVRWKFCSFILKENIERVLTLKIKDNLKKQVVKAIQGALSVLDTVFTPVICIQFAVATAASDARSAWSARSARSDAYVRYANKLLSLLREEGK